MHRILALVFAILAGPAAAQSNTLPNVVAPNPAAWQLSAQQLQTLVASIALYPDPILTDILAASTYPAQIVEAERFLTDPVNSSLQGEALQAAAAEHGWDDSIMALLAFPQLVRQMDANLEFTEHLGQVFIAQPADVLAAIQTLRKLAEAAGTLADSPDASVADNGGIISIEPPSPEQIYLPSYNDACAFGPNTLCNGTADLSWSSPIVLPFGGQAWGEVDWSVHKIRLGAKRQWGGQHETGFWRHPDVRRGEAPGRPFAIPSGNTVYGRTMLYGHGAPHVTAPSARPVFNSSILAPHTVVSHGVAARPAPRAVAPPPPAPHIGATPFHH